MKMLRSLLVFVILLPPCSAHRGPAGLFCTNDLVHNVSCSWTGSWTGSFDDCWVSGVKKVFNKRKSEIIRSCKMKQHKSSSPGCSLVFEGTQFSGSAKMPNISMTCNGTLIANITNYRPVNYIMMHAPDAPHVNITVNYTQILWRLGKPVSYLFKSGFDFEVQVKRREQSWTESRTLPKNDQELKIPVWELKGASQVRVRVKPSDRENSHWSAWSPTTSWEGATTRLDSPTKQGRWLDQTSLMVTGVLLTFLLVIVVVTALYKNCKNRELLKGKPVPNPSKYLETLPSGNPKRQLSGSEFVFVPSCDHISPVEVCQDWEVMVPSLSPSSSSISALLHPQNYPPSASGSSGVVFNSSSLSSFSNMGYFISSSSSGSAGTDPHLAYFTYNDPFQTLPTIPQPSLCDTFSSDPDYESLKKEPESPDSGFGIKEDQEEDLNEHRSLFLVLPLHFPSHTRLPSSPPSPAVAQISSIKQELDVSEMVAAAGGAGGGGSAAAAMCRSSSMPVETFKSDYLTLKELQSTFSNKSM
ncbi:interleukin-2 receptor subunit beta [Nematolebias whitei]|uniref:interleukin-2 receptor subunit beta n=1 Tax=Nematolebias whitei TaxID=451745 RepID=UPI00189B15A8|nr:interleukin-2 receptor subunit beta [Nematolebias whitei]